MPGRLQITWDGAALEDPHILEVNLVIRGRHDIASDDFEQPLEFRVGAKILAILRSASGPNSTAFRAVSFDDDLLKVGPALIRRHQPIRFTLLATGRDPMLTSSAAAVRDVDVEVLPTERSTRNWPSRLKVAVILSVAAGMAAVLLVGLLIGRNNSAPPKNTLAGNKPSASSSPSVSSSTPALADLSAAETDLKSDSHAAQLNGIRKLQSTMTAVPADQPAAVQELARYIRLNSPAGNNDQAITLVIQAAINVLKGRNKANDRGVTIDLSNTNLTSANLAGIDLDNASLVNTDFDTANLSRASLRNANLNYAFVGGASLDGTDLDGADLNAASFYQTIMCHGSVPTQPQRGYNCSASG